MKWRVSIRQTPALADALGRCGAPAECHSAKQQITNLRYRCPPLSITLSEAPRLAFRFLPGILARLCFTDMNTIGVAIIRCGGITLQIHLSNPMFHRPPQGLSAPLLSATMLT